MITDFINDEQLLAILLENQAATDYRMEGLGGELITLYCMEKVGINSPFEDVYREICDLITSHVTENLVKDGLIEPEFTEEGVKYSCTADGEKLSKMFERARNDSKKS